MVSRSRFVRNAKRKAARNHIETLSLQDSREEDWSKLLRALSSIQEESTFPVGTFVFHVQILSGDQFEAGPQHMVYKKNGLVWGTLEEIKNEYLNKQSFHDRLHAVVEKKALQNQSIPILVTIKFGEGIYCIKENGEKQTLLGLQITGESHTKKVIVNSNRASYRDAQIAYASGEIGHGNSFVLGASVKKRKPAAVSVEILKTSKSKRRKA
jgi:hypothetical protein